MGYSLTKLKAELTANHLSEDGLVAWGQNNGMGGIVGSAMNPMHVICSSQNRIIIIPFSNKTINYNQAIAFSRNNIASAKLAGFWIYSKLKISTTDGNKFTYSIAQGKGAIKQLLQKLGF